MMNQVNKENFKNYDQKKCTNRDTEKKRSNKKKTVPPVRHTLTSYKRMLKANPLLEYEEAEFVIEGQKSKTYEGQNSKETMKEFKQPTVNILTKSKEYNLKRSAVIPGNFPIPNKLLNRSQETGILSNDTNSTKIQTEPKTVTSNQTNSKNLSRTNRYLERKSSLKLGSEAYTNNTDCKNYITMNHKIPKLRRSLSSDNIEMGNNLLKTDNYFEENPNVHTCANTPPEISPILGNCTEKNYIFKSPSAYERRSICGNTSDIVITPRSIKKTSMPQTSTPAPIQMDILEEKLDNWLKNNGSMSSSFQYLRKFNDKSKRWVLLQKSTQGNKENLKITQKNETNILISPGVNRNITEYVILKDELSIIAKKAMVELQMLIQNDFPKVQCLGWLELIRQKYVKADEEPEYWECKAGIEESVGNVANAVEFYKTAIIQGAEVTTVDKSLDQLLKKFSLLNISPTKSKQKVDDNKERILREARNVFKSAIIQLAVKERNLKK